MVEMPKEGVHHILWEATARTVLAIAILARLCLVTYLRRNSRTKSIQSSNAGWSIVGSASDRERFRIRNISAIVRLLGDWRKTPCF